ncbi:MAG TPA: hypothetical protein VE130_13615 [Nitrososphaeraceae archaeon]|nr:hypothetical protein [Nitrososphaeraceae archaeon]
MVISSYHLTDGDGRQEGHEGQKEEDLLLIYDVTDGLKSPHTKLIYVWHLNTS